MNTTSASRSITVDRSTILPSSFIASAARARPGPIASATVVPVTGASNRRTEPSGRVMAGMGWGPPWDRSGCLWRRGNLLRKSHDLPVDRRASPPASPAPCSRSTDARARAQPRASAHRQRASIARGQRPASPGGRPAGDAVLHRFTGPPRSVAITGRPIACASITTRPNASAWVEACTTTSDSISAAGMSSNWPTMRTRSAMPSASPGVSSSRVYRVRP